MHVFLCFYCAATVLVSAGKDQTEHVVEIFSGSLIQRCLYVGDLVSQYHFSSAHPSCHAGYGHGFPLYLEMRLIRNHPLVPLFDKEAFDFCFEFASTCNKYSDASESRYLQQYSSIVLKTQERCTPPFKFESNSAVVKNS